MKTPTQNKTLVGLYVAAAFVLLVSPAKAAVLTLYNFSGTNYESADTDPGSTASTIAAGAGPFSVSLNTGVGNPAPSLEFGVNSTTPALALSGNAYFEFTIAPVASATLSLTNITLDLAHTWGNNTIQGFDIYTSIGGFDSIDDIVGSGSRSASGTNVFQNFNVSLGGEQFQNLTSAITFRIYFYDGAAVSTSHQFVDNITVNGTAVVPEPGTWVLFGIGAILVLLRRPRKALAQIVRRD